LDTSSDEESSDDDISPVSKPVLRQTRTRGGDVVAEKEEKPKSTRKKYSKRKPSEKLFMVDKVLCYQKRRDKGGGHRVCYLVQWVGYDEATWEPEESLRSCNVQLTNVPSFSIYRKSQP